ncbi:MAG: NAD(+)/NADH kinase [Acidobacteriota bacterium]
MQSPIQRVGIVTKPQLGTHSKVLRDLMAWFADRNIEVLLDHESAANLGDATGSIDRLDLPSQCDLVVLLGGDGTFLSLARAVGSENVIILPVNFGSLGFLTEITLEETFGMLDIILQGKARTQKRMMIEVAVVRAHICHASFRALNDAVVTKGTLARIIDIDVRIDRKFVATYKADGLIVSTPTGSTAYALSAGGPILFPTLDAMLVTPICSHTLTFRSLVVPDTVEVELSLQAIKEPVYLTVDGQIGLELEPSDILRVRKSPATITIVESENKNFFDILRNKLKWGER